MNMQKIALTVLLSYGGVQASWQDAYTTVAPWYQVDFDVSMHVSSHQQAIDVTQDVTGYDGMQFLDFARELFEKNNPSVLQISERLIIPKDMHQIWLGAHLPQVFLPLIQSWKEHHKGRGWRHFLWVDNEENYIYGDIVVTTEQQLFDVLSQPVHEVPETVIVDVRAITLDNQIFYDQVDNYGVKSDLLKWEIIYRYGGVYIDTDFECLKPLDILHYTYDFYTGMQPLDTLVVQLGAALFAGHPKHPILKHCIETIKDDWHHNGAPKKSGPVHFSKSFLMTAGKDGSCDVALPGHYLYPLGCRQAVSNDLRDEVYNIWLNNGSYAVHHWAKSWMPKHYRPLKFREMNNDESSKSWND